VWMERVVKQVRSLSQLAHSLRDSHQSSLMWALWLGLFLQLALCVGAYLLWNRHLFAPILQLEKRTHELAEGKSDKRLKFGKKTQLGRLAGSINHLVDQMRGATQFVKAIEGGDLDARFEEGTADAALAKALVNMKESMQRIAREDAQRNWATQGLARFVDILRNNHNDLNTLGDQILSNLIEYTKANQGGLYVLHNEENDDVQLELVACYAFGKKKYRKQLIEAGEGLLGQAFMEGKTKYMLEIPEDYLSITSGLGGARPKTLLMVPLTVNDEIYGMVELASFNPFAKHEIDFIEKLAESIASTLASVKANSRTRKLLEESQEMTEQMRAQEEEMRQNMEELAATQEEMARKEVELAGQIEALNKNLLMVQIDGAGRIVQLNMRMEELLRKSADEVRNSPLTRWIQVEDSVLQQAIEGVARKVRFTADGRVFAGSLTPVENRKAGGRLVILLADEVEAGQGDRDSVLDELEQHLRVHLEAMEITRQAEK
jgi:PAS domain-containing protein/HAMP domain-containing protein